MGRRDSDCGDTSAKLLCPKNCTAAKTAADVQQLSELGVPEVPKIRSVSQHPLLRLDQLRARAGGRGRLLRLFHEARVIVKTWPRPIALQNRLRLPLIV